MVSVEGKRGKERKCVAGGGKNWKGKKKNRDIKRERKKEG